jgi:hypothetical protein
MGVLFLSAAATGGGGGVSDSFSTKVEIVTGIAIILDVASFIVTGLNNKYKLLKKLIEYRKQYNLNNQKND